MNRKTVNFNISFDPIAGAMYLQTSDNKVAKTIELEDEVFVDVDSKGNFIGAEFLNPSKIDIKINHIIKVFKTPPGLKDAFNSFANAASLN